MNFNLEESVLSWPNICGAYSRFLSFIMATMRVFPLAKHFRIVASRHLFQPQEFQDMNKSQVLSLLVVSVAPKNQSDAAAVPSKANAFKYHVPCLRVSKMSAVSTSSSRPQRQHMD